MKRIFVLLIVSILIGCSPSVEITFNDSDLAPIAGRSGEIIQLPEPSRDGYGFFGWYLDESLTQKVQDSYVLTEADVILYPDWKREVTISFGDLRNFEDLIGYEGEPLVLPELENVAGFMFENWYLDPFFTKPFLESEFGSEDITLYSNFLRRPEYIEKYLFDNYEGTTKSDIGDWYYITAGQNYMGESMLITYFSEDSIFNESIRIELIRRDYSIEYFYTFDNGGASKIETGRRNRSGVYTKLNFLVLFAEGAEKPSIGAIRQDDVNFIANVESDFYNSIFPFFEVVMDDIGLEIEKIALN